MVTCVFVPVPLICVQEVFRRAALEQLRGRVAGQPEAGQCASATADMDGLLEQQAELTRRDREVAAGVDSVQVCHPQHAQPRMPL